MSSVMHVPLLDLQAQYRTIKSEAREAIDRVCDAQQFIQGPEVQALEEELAAFCGAQHAIGMSSGTDALLAALMVTGIGPGDEVLTTPYSFFATAGAIARLGARAVFADIEPSSFNLDPQRAVAAITHRTRAALPVHLFGRAADLGPLVDAGRERPLVVIEDAAQAVGCRDERGRPIGRLGAMACLSFFPSKNLGAFGDGGLVLTNDGALAESLRTMRVHGARRKYHHEVVGGNFRLDAIQAAVLRVKLGHLESWNRARRRNAERYRRLFAEARGCDSVVLPEDSPGHVYNQFVVRCPDRDALQTFLKSRAIGTEVYYPSPLHLQPCFRGWGYGPGDFPESERAARESLALPIYPELTEEQQRYVVATIGEFEASRPVLTSARAA
jgi:dTDP-4-amino-4,6-dideoxygalactose transaminase